MDALIRAQILASIRKIAERLESGDYRLQQRSKDANELRNIERKLVSE